MNKLLLLILVLAVFVSFNTANATNLLLPSKSNSTIDFNFDVNTGAVDCTMVCTDYGIVLDWTNITNTPTFLGNFTDNINYSAKNTNSSDFWDDLDSPADITGSEYWYNHTLDILTNWNASWLSTYNLTYANWNKTYADTLYSPVGNDGHTLNLLNITGTDSNQCAGTDKVSNVTIVDGDLSVVCTTDETGAGGTYNTTYANTSADVTANRSEWFSTFNSTYANTTSNWDGNASMVYNHTLDILTNWNASWLSTYNLTYSNWNKTYADTLYGLSTWNSSYANATYLNLSGTNAKQDINISNYNLSCGGLITNTTNYFGGGQYSDCGRLTTNIAGRLVCAGENTYNATYATTTEQWNGNASMVYNHTLATYNLWNANWITTINTTYANWNKTYADTLYVDLNSANKTTLALQNITGSTNTTTCDAVTGKLVNVTFANGVISGICGTDQTSSGGTYNTTYANTSADVTANRSSWLSTINTTYANFNKTYADTLYSPTGNNGHNLTYNNITGRTIYYLTGAKTTNATGLTQVTLFTMPILANTNYTLDCYLLVSSNVTTSGILWNMSLPAIPTWQTSSYMSGLTATTIQMSSVGSCDGAIRECVPTVVATSTLYPATLPTEWHSYIENAGTGGNILFRFSGELATLRGQVHRGSYCETKIIQ